MQEAKLYNYWEYYKNSAQTIYWQERRLKILHTGTLNEHQGPDFKYARFELNDVVYQGAVEFHIDAADWYNHNHHQDPAYQDVVLHVVAHPPGNKQVTRTVSGHLVPIFVLPAPTKDYSTITCVPGGEPADSQLKKILQQLALQRLLQKAQSFGKALKNSSEHYIFYKGFMRILGYPFNKHAFEMLAHCVPVHLYELFKNRPQQLMALYFGCSGFLQGSYQDQFAVGLKKLFVRSQASLSGATLNPARWQMSAVRPLNHPHFRIAAWIALLVSFHKQAPFTMLYQHLQQRLQYPDMYKSLQAVLSIKTSGYWQDHYALQRRTGQKKNRVYLGEKRINELLTNLIIPLSLSKAIKNNDLGFVSYLREFYLQMPGHWHYGSMLRKQPWLADYKNIWQSCNTGQAFLHLNELYCSRKQCKHCPLQRKKVS